MSLIATRVDAWKEANPNFDKNMFRPYEVGALDFFVQQNQASDALFSPDFVNRVLASAGNDVKIPALNYDGDVVVNNFRSCVIPSNDNTSALFNVVWVTFASGFSMVPSQYTNNHISYQHDFNRKMEKMCREIAKKMDAQALSVLEANKTQVIGNTLGYTYSSDTIAAPFGMRNEVFGDMGPMMRSNDFGGQIHIIGNSGVDSIANKLAEHGLYNDVNKALQLSDKIFHFTNGLANSVGDYATGYAVESGNVGILSRVDRESLAGASASGHEWDVVNLPFIGLPFGAHHYVEVGDQSQTSGAATADLVCARREFFGFSIDVAFVVAYNSAISSVANPIIKFTVGGATGSNPYAQPVTVVDPVTVTNVDNESLDVNVTNTETAPVYTSEVQ